MSRFKKQINLRISLADFEVLSDKAQASGLSLSEYLRRCGLLRELPSPARNNQGRTAAVVLSKLVKELSTLVAIAQSLNQIEVAKEPFAGVRLTFPI